MRPVPTPLAVALFAGGMLPAVLAILFPEAVFFAAAVDLAVLALCAVDFALAPTASQLRVTRKVEPVLSSGAPNAVVLVLESLAGVAARGEVRDSVPPGPSAEGHRQRFRLEAPSYQAKVRYRLVPPSRGDLALGDIYLRLLGPLGLCARQERVPAAAHLKVYPDLTALTREALELARAAQGASDRSIRRPAEGREFESLREYREGDDSRTIDWKASARKAKLMVRVHQPERHQPVMLMLDCGRHMAGRVAGRRKLDHAVDAALRLAKVSLDRGDLVGVVAFSTEVLAMLPPRKGREHLRSLTEALYRLEAALEESDYGGAMDLAFGRHHKRSLVAIFTDLMDPETSSQLVNRARRLRPRHLPLVVSLLDEDLESCATAEPTDVHQAYRRQAAARLEEEYRLTAAQLRNSGALVVRAPPSAFSAAAVNEYLRVKAHGLL
ncbi:MAG: DUF58 domain-containing protein [Myxococcales bacterium]|nr:DUF58 domain-containing protein [Myxococcales bacterium]